jgi:hypothetical protein
MEKLITIYPHKSNYKDIFENFNSTLFSLNDEVREKWREYREKYNFSPNHFGNGGSFDSQNWKGMYDNVPEAIELWTIQGTDFGLDTPLRYDEFTKILKGRKFVPPPFGTGLWLPEEFHKQNIYFEDRLWIFSPIVPYGGKSYKTVQIVLNRSANFQDGVILGSLEDLRPTETWIDPKLRRVVQRILD